MIKSVLQGKDNEVLPILLALHAPVEHPRILDVTYNQGTMWRGLNYAVTSMDIDPQFKTDITGDFTAIPCSPSSFDVIVFDPPHLPVAAASVHSSKLWEKRYGITADRAQSDDISAYFVPFLYSAQQVLRPGGIILAKIADIVHNHRYQWQHVRFIEAVEETGMTACDLLVKMDPSAGNLISGKWKIQHHLRKAHCYWIVVRNSRFCE